MNRHDLQDLGGGTLGGLLAARSAVAPENPVLVFAGTTYSYREVDAAATSAAFGLIALGLQPGDVAAIFTLNRPEHLFAWFGSARAGLTYLAVNAGYKGALLQHILEHSGSKVLILEAALADALLTLDATPQTLRTIVFLDGIPAEFPCRGLTVMSWQEMLAGGSEDGTFPVIAPHDTGRIGYTSGTTGKSKGVVSPHLQSLVMARESATAFGISARDRMYTCMPLFHGMAQVTTCLTALYAGATILLSPKFSVSRLWDELRDTGATQFNCLGSMLHMLLSAPPSPRDRDHAVTRVFAAPAPPEVLYRFEARFGVQLIEGYGQTEIKNVLYNPLSGRKIGSLGRPTASTILEIHDDNGNALPPGQVGEIVYRPRIGNIMLKHYLKEPEKTLANMAGLWWHTGDLGSMDADGFFYFFDRKTDSLRRRGENISSQELEGMLMGYPCVIEAAVVATPSEVGENEVLAVLQVSDTTAFDIPGLHRHCMATMPRFMVPRFYRVTAAFPRTPTGKVRKIALREEGVTADTWDATPPRPAAA
jgi:crotonobetaine/carnitine-CoA ligase